MSRRWTSTPIPPIAAIALAAGLGLYAWGIVLRWRDPEGFLVWIREDGLVEWLTFAVLLAAAARAFLTSALLRRPGEDRRGAGLWLVLGGVLLFGALEEISYGQRVFGWGTPEWLRDLPGDERFFRNEQSETNFHNLALGGFSVNRVIFGKFLAVFLVLYVLVLPLLHRRVPAVRAFVERWRIPIVQPYQVAAWLVVLAVTRIALRRLPSDPGRMAKVQELQEFMGSVLFYLAIRHPWNADRILGRDEPSPTVAAP